MRKRQWQLLLLASLTASSIVSPSLHAAPATSAPTAPLPAPKGPRPASPVDLDRYGALERASPDALNFRGGEATVVVGASTVTLILAVVLLIVLL